MHGWAVKKEYAEPSMTCSYLVRDSVFHENQIVFLDPLVVVRLDNLTVSVQHKPNLFRPIMSVLRNPFLRLEIDEHCIDP